MDGASATASSAARGARRALVADGDAAACATIRLHLILAGFDVTEAASGAHAIVVGRTMRFEVIVLDAALPEVDGLAVCGALRAHGPNLDSPILMLSTRDAEADRVAGLDSGADDFMGKPFGTRELIARVNALVRRHERAGKASALPDAIERHGVLVDVRKRIAVVRGRAIDLTRQEFDLLHLLLSRPGVVFSRDALVAKICGGVDIYVTRRTVDTVISRLRQKLEANPDKPTVILTAWGIGYKCADTE
jgi:two-component system, OmpR family, alkaline phosphatase synthesis response regulator PhoP